jgi:hypothetical protein
VRPGRLTVAGSAAAGSSCVAARAGAVRMICSSHSSAAGGRLTKASRLWSRSRARCVRAPEIRGARRAKS